MIARLSNLIWPPPVGLERALLDTAKALQVSEYQRIRAELERLVAAAYARRSFDA